MNTTFRRDFTSETKRRIRKSRKALGICLAAIVLTMAFVAMAPAVAAQPITIDGNDSDWEGLAGVQCISDPFGDIYIVNGSNFINGFDMLEFCMFYDAANDTIYFKFNVSGVPGDTDGDGDPNNTSDPDNITDSFEVGPDDAYIALIDLDADPSIDYRLEYKNNTVLMREGFSGTTIIPGTAAGSIDGPSYTTDTIAEMSYYPLHNLSGFGECNHFEIRGWSGSLEEGLGEDQTSDLLLNDVPEPIIETENVCFCNNVTFNGSASYDPDGNITNWTWDFGDGNFGYGEIVEHHYDEPREYAVTLTVTDDFNAVCSNTTNVTVYTNPTANFTAPPVCFGFPTIFTDFSVNGSGSIVNWTWDFGDNTSLNYSQNTAHTYAGPGEYSVTLTVTDDNNCTNFTTKNVTVSEGPIANFTFDNACFCTNVSFFDATTNGTAPYTYSWDFDNDSVYELVGNYPNPTWHYGASGPYTARLFVEDEAGCIDEITKEVEVYENPEANFTFNNICYCTNTTFTSTSSGGEGTYTYRWDFDNDGSYELEGNYPDPTWHLDEGTNQVRLNITDANNCSNETIKSVEVYENPIADFTATNPCFCTNTTFTDASSGGSGTYTYAWDFNNDGVTDSTAQNPTWHFNTTGTHPVTLNITDENGCTNETTKDVTVNENPVANFTFNNVCYCTNTTFTSTSSGGSGTYTYRWDFDNDGTYELQGVGSSYANPTWHLDSGTNQVRLNITDSNGCSNETTKDVEVYPNPTASIKVTPPKRCDLTVVFDGTATGGTPNTTSPYYSYKWDLGDGNTSIEEDPIHTYAEYRTYLINLTVTDANGCNATTKASVSLTCVRPNLTIRVYGEDDIGPKCPYEYYRDPFDPTAIQKDSLTFNPAIILWNGTETPMSADSNNIHEKKFLRLWYEPAHVYSKDYYIRPTIEVESTYMLVDRQDWIPISGSAATTFFQFPIVEIPGQIGLGGFENEGIAATRPNVVTLSLVANNSAMEAFNKTTDGKIRIEKTYTLNMGEGVQFLDHKLIYNYVLKTSTGSYATVTVSYAGNLNDDAVRTVSLGKFDGDSTQDPFRTTWFDRHNIRSVDPVHPDTTWYARFVGYSPTDQQAMITVGKELELCDTFYVNGVRYDVMAIEVIDTDGDSKADEFKYITIKTPLPKGKGDVADDGIVSTQRIECIDFDEIIPLNPPFNENHLMVDDINVVLWEPSANEVEWPVGDKDGILGETFFPWAERYLTMQEEAIKNEVQFGLPVGEIWWNYFDVTPIDMDDDGIWIAHDVDERILEVPALSFVYIEELREPRFTTDLYEILEEGPVASPPTESWMTFDINTRPDNYTAFELPALPDVVTPYITKPGDYLLTSSFLAPNSIDKSELNRTPPGIPRVAFAHDVEYESDVLDETLMGGALDIYVNDYNGLVSVRIYGEYDEGPVSEYAERGIYTYTDYQQPFDPAYLQKDSITFNPAIVRWNGSEYPMSAYKANETIDIDVKKHLRMWYEPEHKYSKNVEWGDQFNYTYPTIEVETTYVLIDSQDKEPICGAANNTHFVFAIAEDVNTTQPGLELFENPNSRPTSKNVVTLAGVEGTVSTDGWTTEGKIRIQKTYDLSKGESVRFLDHMLTYNDLVNDGFVSVDIWYTGNTDDEPLRSGVILGDVSGNDPHAITWFDRHCNPFADPDHPGRKWYAQFEGYQPPHNDSTITVGIELEAGDVFYVDGVRYDVPAIMVIDGDSNGTNGAELFKYITLRTPLPKRDGIRVTTETVPDSGIITSQEIVTIPPETIIPLNPPFNMEHDIVDDISHNYNYLPDDVEYRIIEGYDPLEVYYIVEAIEPRYSTNLLEILNETFHLHDEPDEDWIKYDVITRPDQYTEFILPFDEKPLSSTLRNDYLITTSFLANNSIGKSDLIDPVYDPIPRVAFVFDAIDNRGIYINRPAGAPPVVFNEAPTVNVTITPGTTVSALTAIMVCTNGTTDDAGWPLSIQIDWKDGTSETKSMPDEWTPICFEHKYLEKGTYTISVSATDVYGLKGTETYQVTITNDGAILVIRPGWNLISIPVNDTLTVDSVFDPDTNLWFGGVWYYAGGWIPLTQKTDKLYPEYGYFVYGPLSGTAEIEVTGTAATFNDTWMVSGWNLLGVGYEPQEVPYWAYWWDSGAYVYIYTHSLQPGRGYFVKIP